MGNYCCCCKIPERQYFIEGEEECDLDLLKETNIQKRKEKYKENYLEMISKKLKNILTKKDNNYKT